MIDPKRKAWIDSASYEELLNKWRFAPIGDAFFHGETGRYYAEVMAERRAAHPDPVAASKRVGWDKP